MSRTTMRRSTFLTGGVAGLAATSLAACSGGASPSADPHAEPEFGADTRMSLFGTSERKAKVDEVFGLYTEKFGGSVDAQVYANDSYAEKLATEMAGGAAADLVAMFQHVVAQYAWEDLLVNLDEWGKILDVSGLDQDAIAAGVIEGKRTALPLGDNAYAAFYDSTRLEALGFTPLEPGHSWDEFIAFSHDVTTKSGGSYYGTIDASGDMNFFEVFLRQSGKSLYSEEGALGFTASDVQEWFQVWEDLRKDGVAPKAGLTAESVTGGFGTSLLVTGDAANFFIFGNVFKGFSALTENDLALTTPPVGSDRTGLYVRASNWMGAYARGENIDDAVNMVDFVVNNPEAGAVLGAEFGAPSNLEVRDSIDYEEHDQVFVDYVDLVASDFTEPIPDLGLSYPEGSDRMENLIKSAGEAVASGQQSVTDGAAQFVEQMERFLG